MIPIENNSWDYVQGLIEKEINSAFKLRIKEDNKMKFEEDHPYMIKLDEVLKQYSVVKVADTNGAHHGADFEGMKQVILDALFTNYLGNTIRK
jgi:hypothetical protein